MAGRRTILLEELRLEADNYLAVRDRTLLRLLAALEADRAGSRSVGRRGISLPRLRAQHGLFTRADLDLWLEANGIDSKRLERLVADETRFEAISTLAVSTSAR